MFPGITCLLWLLPPALIYLWFIRPLHQHWGATDMEVFKPLPGDELVPTPRVEATRAITIQASVEAVWPWLVQLGFGRAGFYTFDAIERTRTHDGNVADRVIPAFQDLALGDRIALSGEGPYLEVERLQPPQTLALYGYGHPLNLESYGPEDDPSVYMKYAWVFVVTANRDGSTRLVVRERYDFRPWWPSGVVVHAAALGSAVMSAKMLRTIKRRAEAS